MCIFRIQAPLASTTYCCLLLCCFAGNHHKLFLVLFSCLLCNARLRLYAYIMFTGLAPPPTEPHLPSHPGTSSTCSRSSYAKDNKVNKKAVLTFTFISIFQSHTTLLARQPYTTNSN